MNDKIYSYTQKKTFGSWQFVKISVLVNFIIHKSKSTHLNSLSQFSLVTRFVWGNERKYLTHIPGQKQAKNVAKHNKKKRNRRNKARKAAAAKALAEVEAEKVMGGNTESSEIEKPQQTKEKDSTNLELVSKELYHLAAILHVYAGGLNFMK